MNAPSSGRVTISLFENLREQKALAKREGYRGRDALRVADAILDEGDGNEDRLVVVEGCDFGDGTIDLDVSGEPIPGAFGQARGFVGIAFHVAGDLSSFEALYLRPTNGRASDQVRRNHSIQYISYPDYPWHRSRRETPERYESYVDLVPGEWTHMRVEVSGQSARLHVHGNEQPNLLVGDLKLGARTGLLGLWIGPSTLAHFADLRITRG